MFAGFEIEGPFYTFERVGDEKYTHPYKKFHCLQEEALTNAQTANQNVW